MEEEIKNLLSCGYYDESHDYIVEMDEFKMKQFFKKFFNADTVIIFNSDMEKMKKENQNLIEKLDSLTELHRKQCAEMKEYVDKTSHDVDITVQQIMNEQEKRYCELKEQGKLIIKALANYI